jgi:hypothetical protein
MTDLARLAWVDAPLPAAPPIQIALYSGDLLIWARKGLKAGGWPDAASFVRELVRRHARLDIDGPLPADDLVDGLTATDLDAIAETLLANGEIYFRPKFVVEGSGDQRRIRRRRDEEICSLPLVVDETASARLLRIVTTWTEDQQLADAHLLQTATGASISRAAKHMKEAQRIAADFRKFGEMNDVAARFANAARRADPVVRFAREQRERIQRLGLSNLPRIAAIDPLKPYRDTFAGLHRLGAMNTETVRALSMQHAAADLLGATRGWQFAAARIAADQRKFARDLSQLYDLRLPAATLSAIAAAQVATASFEAPTSVFAPGYQLTAAIGFEPKGPQGLVAEVLRHYGEDHSVTPLFDSALAAPRLADQDDITEDQVVEAIEGVAVLSAAARAEQDPVRRQALQAQILFWLEILGFLIACASLAVALKPDNNVAQLVAEARADHAAQAKAQREQAGKDHFYRYPRGRAPLRAEPRAGAPRLQYVWSEQLLRVTDEHGDWLKVEVLNYVDQVIATGWIHRSWVSRTPAN